MKDKILKKSLEEAKKGFKKILDEYPDDYQFTKKQVLQFTLNVMEGSLKAVTQHIKKNATTKD